MPTPDLEPSQHMRLRLDAETRLQAGLAPATQGWSTGAAALTLLHKLASPTVPATRSNCSTSCRFTRWGWTCNMSTWSISSVN